MIDEIQSDEAMPFIEPHKISKFKSRKPKSSFTPSLQSSLKKKTIIKTTAFGDEDSEYEDDDIISKKIPLKLKRKTALSEANENHSTVGKFDTRAADIQDYLSSYGDTSDVFREKKRILIKKDIKKIIDDDVIMVNNDIKPVTAADADAEGFVLEGSDLEDSDVEFQKSVAKVKEKIDSLDKNEEARRRKEIEEALLVTDLNNITDSEHENDKLTDDIDNINLSTNATKNTYSIEISFIDSPETSSVSSNKLATPYTIPKYQKGKMIFQNVPSFERQKEHAKQKVCDLCDIMSKRELQMQHLKKEHEKLGANEAEYTSRMNQAFRLCQ